MSTYYRINFAQQALAVNGNIKIYQSGHPWRVYALQDDKLESYELESDKWLPTLLLKDLKNATHFHSTDIFRDGHSIVIVKTENGMRFYRHTNDNHFIPIVNEDEYMDDYFMDKYYGWNESGSLIKFGHFYSDSNLLGILTYRRKNGPELFAVMKDSLANNEYPVMYLDKSMSILGNGSIFELSDLERSGQEEIIAHDTSGLNIYRINESLSLQHVMEIPNNRKIDDSEERLFFPSITGNPYHDIVLLNSTGLFVYQYSDTLESYEVINRDHSFSTFKGWKSMHTDSIHFNDINSDGRQEMIFTGPKGMNLMSFNNQTNNWTSLLDNSEMTIDERYRIGLEVIPASPPTTRHPIIFTKHQNQLHWAEVVEGTVDDDDIEREKLPDDSESPAKTAVIPSIGQLNVDRSMVLLRDQLDFSSILKSNENDNGKPKFRLPLVDLSRISSNLMVNIFYDGKSQASDILGMGWSMPQTFIIMNNRGSILPEDVIYYIVVGGMSLQLTFDSTKGNETKFKLSNDDKNTRVVYYKDEERWEILNDEFTQAYGRIHSKDSNLMVNWSLRNKYSAVVDDKLNGNYEHYANVWYIVEARDKYNSSLRYTYDIISATVPSGKVFTREIYPKSISDDRGNTVIFNYSDKNDDEYELAPLADQINQGLSQRVLTQYLSGYSLVTSKYYQDIDFGYIVENGKRFLTNIYQKNDYSTEPILKFSYENDIKKNLLNKVVLPTGASIEFSYQLQGESIPDVATAAKRYEVDEHHHVDYVGDYTIVTYLDLRGTLVVRIFNLDMSEELYSSIYSQTAKQLPRFGKGYADSYDILLMDQIVALLLHYKDDKELYFLRCIDTDRKEKEEKWLPMPMHYTFSKEQLIRFGWDFIVVSDTKSTSIVNVISWDDTSKEWKSESPFTKLDIKTESLTFVLSHRMIVMYDNHILVVAYRNRYHEWQYKIIKEIRGIFTDIKSTLDLFDLEEGPKSELLTFFKNYALQISNNIIILNRWKVKKQKLYTSLDLFVLDGNYNVKHDHYRVDQDDLDEFSLEIAFQGGSYYTFRYKDVDGQFKVVATSLRGTIENELIKNFENKNRRDDARKAELERMSENAKHYFLLNYYNYTAFAKAQIVVCSKTKFTFVDDDWQKDAISDGEFEQKEISIPFGKKFILHKEDGNSTLKLYEQTNDSTTKKLGKVLFDLNVKYVNETVIGYPVYIAYQPTREPVTVTEFANDGSVGETYQLPQKEKLSAFSNYHTLVTTASTENRNDLFFRHQLGMKRLLPDPVITKVTLNFDENSQRTIGYEYSDVKAFGDSLFYQKIATISNDNKTSFGWTEEIKTLTNPSTTEKLIFDAQKRLVKTLKFEETEDDESEEEDAGESSPSKMKLFDKTGKLEVVQMFPYNVTSEVVGYYGFEDYEANRIGNNSEWHFNQSDVVKHGFSFTGHNYLHLSNNSLTATFRPNNLNQLYLASCWMRAENNTLETGDTVPYVKAVTTATNRNDTISSLGEVKFQFGDWFYLEAIVNMFDAGKFFNETKTNDTNTQIEHIDLITTVIVAASLNTTIDVDHVRFTPIDTLFKAGVYDSKTGQLKEIISASGLVERHYYDKYGNRIAMINGYGELKEVNTYTKASSIDRISKLRCKMTIQPELGFYEVFTPFSFEDRWDVDVDYAWQISPGVLEHLPNESHTLQLISNKETASYGLRLSYDLQSDGAAIQFGDNLQLSRETNLLGMIRIADKKQRIPIDGELIIIIEGRRMVVFVDGGIYFDGQLKVALFTMEIAGRMKMSDVIAFYKPSVQITYNNALGEKVQEILLENENTSIVTEYLYDEIGRQTITTQSARVEWSNNESVLTYNSNFVVNKNPLSIDAAYKTGKLQGRITKYLDEFDFNQIVYCDNPLNKKCVVGLAGKEFSVTSPFATHYSHSPPNDLFIQNLFPTKKNYHFVVQHKVGDVEDVSVFDEKDNKVAWYISTTRSKNLLSTYEYDTNGNLTNILPPLYHDKINTLHMLNPHLNSTTEEEKTLQELLGVHITYDVHGKIVSKSAPDCEKVENIYDKDGFLRFAAHGKENIVYFDYDQFGRLRSTGEVVSPIDRDQLLKLDIYGNATKLYQTFDYDNYDSEPILRGNMARTVTVNNDDYFLIEETFTNLDEDCSTKRMFVPIKNKEESTIFALNKRYEAGRLKEIEYPFSVQNNTFSVVYNYNKLGQVAAIGVPGKKNLFASFAYNANGQITVETYLPESVKNFTRQYDYNSAGFLISLKDKLLTQKLYYTEGGYGGYGYSDGTITRTEFQATWHSYSDSNQMGLSENSFISDDIDHEESATCYRELIKAGYIDDNGHQTKIFYPKLELNLPILCSHGATGRHIQNIIGKSGFPTHYGYSFDYGNYQELTKGKYFIGDVPMPLQPETFAQEISGINGTVSHSIWNILRDAGYLIQRNDKSDVDFSHGKIAKSFINPKLVDDLRRIQIDDIYTLPLELILTKYFSQKLNISSLESIVKDVLVKWNVSGNVEDVTKIVTMLKTKGYLENPLSQEFTNELKQYQPFLRDIVRVMFDYFGKGLGEAEFDVESYSIDANGNHMHFFTGFDHYELSYHNNTNKINNVNFQSFASSEKQQDFSIKHDYRGNVIQALHKGIQEIVYHPVSNRAIKMMLTNGNNVTFNYDAKGGRVMKRVTDFTGRKTKEVHYVRDEFGRTLVEHQFTYFEADTPPDILVTAYIYGPRGLLGFIRKDEFYSVLTDQQGSIRLIVKGDETVAAYDYLPYGNIMREFGNDPDAQISYKYTGQEWDEEIGLYNYHARFYDPSIGRFYQIDPMEQYFSPYKYAGNSPVSMVDPNGEVAFVVFIPFIVAGILGGAYLGASAANNRWNPADWDLKSRGTWIGLVGGGIAGGFLPVGFVGSAGALAGVGVSAGLSYASAMAASVAITTTLGIGSGFLGMAAANHDFDPKKWNLQSPETWNAALNGFALGSSLPAGVSAAREAYLKLTEAWSKTAFIVGGVSFGTGSFVLSGIHSDWDFSKPDIYFGLLQAFDDATNFPTFIQSAYKSLSKSLKEMRKGIKSGRRGSILDGARRMSGYKYATFAFTKMTSKVALMTAMSLILTELHDGLDLSNPNTYFNIVRQMNSVNLHYSLAKKFYKNKLKPHSRSESERLIDGESENRNRPLDERTVEVHFEVTPERVNENGNQMRPDPIDQSESNIQRMKELSKNIAVHALDWVKEIQQKTPSTSEDRFKFTAISTAMSDDYTTVMFSGNDGGRGFVMLYHHPVGEGTRFQKVGMLILHDNSQIATHHPLRNQRVVDNDILQILTRSSDFYLVSQSELFENRVVLNPNRELNTIILDAMDNVKTAAIQLNEKGLKEFVNGEKFKNLPDIDGNLKDAFEFRSMEHVEMHGGMTKQTISEILENRLKERISELFLRKRQFDKAIASLEAALNGNSRTVLNRAIDSLKSAMGNAFTDDIRQLIRKADVHVSKKVNELRQRFDKDSLEESQRLVNRDGSESVVKEMSDDVRKLKTNFEKGLETLKTSIAESQQFKAFESIDSLKRELGTAFTKSIDDSMKAVDGKKQQVKKLTDDNKTLAKEVQSAETKFGATLTGLEDHFKRSLKLDDFFNDPKSKVKFNKLVEMNRDFQSKIKQFKGKNVQEKNKAIEYFKKELGEAFTETLDSMLSTGKTTDMEHQYKRIYQENVAKLLKAGVDVNVFFKSFETKTKFDSEMKKARDILEKGKGDINKAVESLKRVAVKYFPDDSSWSSDLRTLIDIKNKFEEAQRTNTELKKQIEADELNLRNAADQLEDRFRNSLRYELGEHLKTAEPVYQYETVSEIKRKMDTALDQLERALKDNDTKQYDAAMESLKDVADNEFRMAIGDAISLNDVAGTKNRIQEIYLNKLRELLKKINNYSESLVNRLNDINEFQKNFTDEMNNLTNALKAKNDQQIAKAIETLKRTFGETFTKEIRKFVESADPELQKTFEEFERNLQKFIEYEQKMDTMKIEESLRRKADQLAEKIWKEMGIDLQKDLRRIPPWKPTNCAEPHAITAFAKLPKLFDVKGQKLKYLGTYTTDHMKEFPACGHCQITTKYPDFSVITEPKKKADNPKENEKKKPPSRTRRSTFDKQNEDFNSIDDRTFTSTHDSDSIISKTMSYSGLNSIFAWIKSGGENMKSLASHWSGNDTHRSEDVTNNVSLSQIDANSTILLLDLLIRKNSGRKHQSTHQRTISELEAVGYAIDITEKFEKIIERAAGKSKLSFEALGIDFSKLQGEITGKIVSCRTNEILVILKSYAENSSKPEAYDKNAKEMRMFKQIVDNEIEKYWGQIISEMTRCT